MATQSKTTGLTYGDLATFPDDNLRREIIDGELLVTPAPGRRHQEIVLELGHVLLHYSKVHGGEALVAPVDVRLSDVDVVQPDLVFIRADRIEDLGEESFVGVPPDLVIEVSSATTRRDDLTRKKDLYKRYAVPEYWFVDLDADRIEIYRFVEGRDGQPELFGRGETVSTDFLPGLTVRVDEILGLAES